MCTFYYSFQPSQEITEKETDFQGDKQYYKVQRRKMIRLGKFLQMIENMSWFRRTNKILSQKKKLGKMARKETGMMYN